MSEGESSFHTITEGGVSADHGNRPPFQALVAPTSTDTDHNALREFIAPLACWMVEDARFNFDSSFVLPEIATEIRLLVALRKRFPEHPLSIFGHADPVGNDDYNKTLSGRRAIAIYALLTRRVDLWEDLFSHPFGNDKWSDEQLVTMAETAAAPPPKDKVLTDEEKAVVFFEETDRGSGCLIFAVDRANEAEKKPAPATPTPPTDPKQRAQQAKSNQPARKELFRAYMDRLCGPDCELKKEEFLGNGADAGGKADFQGCGEFNPILLFSKSAAKEFSKKENKEERDEENTPNRRVLAFLFPKGLRVNPQDWPCPRAKEGATDCHKRFWSDAEKRRGNTETRREYSKTRDTFACRFYDRLAHASPCENAPIPLRIRLYDTQSKFIPHAPYRISISDQPTLEGVASAKGILTVRRRPGASKGLIEWGFKTAEGKNPEFEFKDTIFLEFPDDPQESAQRKLQNIGYSGGAPLQDAVASFQSDYKEQFGLAVTGALDPKTHSAINDVHDGMADQLRDKPA